MCSQQVKKWHPVFAIRIPSPLFLIFAFGLLSHQALCQKIDKSGMFKTEHRGVLYNSGLKVSIPQPADFEKLSAEDLKKIKQILLVRVKAALYNLDDDSLDLTRQYKVIWGDPFLTTLKSELAALNAYLDKGTIDRTVTYQFVPHPDDIEKFAANEVYSVMPMTTQTGYYEFKVVKSDVLAGYLLQRYQNFLANDPTLKKWVMDMAYVKYWRGIESWSEQVKNIKSAAEVLRADVFNEEAGDIGGLDSRLTGLTVTNDLTTALRNSTFIKGWLWYTAAQPAINPLLVTTADLRYPDKEKYSFQTAEKKAAQAELEKKDILKKFQMISRVHNEIQLPFASDHSNFKLHEFDLSEDPVVVKFPDEELDEGEKLKVAIYNMPADKEIALTQGIEPLKYPGKILSELDSVAKLVGQLTALGTGNIATITALSGRLNPAAMKNVQSRFQKADAAAVANYALLAQGLKWRQGYSAFSTEKFKSDTADLNPVLPDTFIQELIEPATVVIINNQYVPLTQDDLHEDKRRILFTTKAYTENGTYTPVSSTDREVIEHFIQQDFSYLDYRSNATFQKDVAAMVARFKTYSGHIKERLEDLDDVITNAITKYDQITPFLRFINRSLPPGKLKPEVDEDPVYLTRVTDVTIPDAPKKINLSITSSVPESKKTKELAKETVKVIQTQRLDVSAGIGYTFSPYDITSQSGAALPTSRTGDPIQFVAGLHIYFLKPLNRLHVNPLKHADEKVAIYLGLTLKNALDHYFAGLSYDLVPGIRLIGGAHFYNNPRFEILNNAVAKKVSGLTNAGGFMSLNIQAATLGKLIGLFK